MRITYDPKVDALSIVFRETTVITRELSPGITGEYDQDGRLVGLEILDASTRFADAAILDQVKVEGFKQVLTVS